MNGQGRPTATVEIRDVSGSRRRASAAPASSEAVLFRAYGNLQPGQSGVFRVMSGREERCMCGGMIVDNGGSIRRLVEAHNATPVHIAWRAWREAS
jgi:hypothetical protein